MAFKNRIKEMKLIKASELTNHDGNWRMHPIFQREAIIGDLEEIGITDVIKAYHSGRNNGDLVIIDGHLRKSIDPDQLWPVLILDLTDDEADKQLILHDSIGGMAATDAEKLDSLIRKAKFENARARAASKRIHDTVREQAEMIRKLREEKEDDGISEAKKMQQKLSEMKGKSVKVVIDVGEGLAMVEDAIEATGIKNRGLALLEICNHYLESNGGEDV